MLLECKKKKKSKINNDTCRRKLSLEPQLDIVLFGISGMGRRPNP